MYFPQVLPVKSKNFQSEYRKYLSGLIKNYSGFAQEHLLSRQLYDLMEGFDQTDVFEKLYPKHEILLDEHFRNVAKREGFKINREKCPGMMHIWHSKPEDNKWYGEKVGSNK